MNGMREIVGSILQDWAVGASVYCVVFLTLGLIGGARAGEVPVTARVSVDSSGLEANGNNSRASVSGDGRYVAFVSEAFNLVPGDTNLRKDIFVHDRQTGVTTRVNVGPGGVETDGLSTHPVISSDGRYVAFESDATTLVSGDTNGQTDIFVDDRQTGLVERVSVDSNGTQADGPSSYPAISAGGRYVAFQSDATNLVNGDTNGVSDVFIHDRQTGETIRLSIDSNGVEGDRQSGRAALAADDRYVAFQSDATNLVPGTCSDCRNIFVHDRQTGQTTLVSMDSSGVPGNSNSYTPSISGDGREVAFRSYASNLVGNDTNRQPDTFVHDRQTGETTRVSVSSSGQEADAGSSTPSISGDGREVAFHSRATNLVPGDTNGGFDVFVHDRGTGETTRVSVDTTGGEGNADSLFPSMSVDARFVAFESSSSNLVSDDTNGKIDIFIRGPELTLAITPEVAGAGDTLTMATYSGVAGNVASLWIVDMSGVPVFQFLDMGSFAGDGTYVVVRVVPPGLAGLDIALRSAALGQSGIVSESNDARVRFQ